MRGVYDAEVKLERLPVSDDNRGPSIVWSETWKKEVRGAEGCDLGEVQSIEHHYVKTQKGVLRRKMFYLPRDIAEGFDGSTLWFGLTRELAEEFRRTTPPSEREYVWWSIPRSRRSPKWLGGSQDDKDYRFSTLTAEEGRRPRPS